LLEGGKQSQWRTRQSFAGFVGTVVMDEADRAHQESEALLAEQLRNGAKVVPYLPKPDGYCMTCFAELAIAGARFCKPPAICAKNYRC
jgi:hypothetical protein